MTRDEPILVGWTHQEQCGLDQIYHRNFDGGRWFELTLFEGGDYIKICRKRVYKPEDVRVMYHGPCASVNDLDYLCKLLEL